MQILGVVKKVYLPEQKGKDGFLDDLNKTNIGFVVEINKKLVEFEVPQTRNVCEICKGDKVLVTKLGKKVELELIDD